MIWELVGYLGSALVLVSLLMSSIIKLRIINMIGSIIFCVYAFKIHSIPTAVMNLALVGINIYFLFRLIKSQKTFSMIQGSVEDTSVQYLLNKYEEDLSNYFDIRVLASADRVYIIYENDTLAGISAGRAEGRNLDLVMDYTTPQYRDCSVGKYLYSKLREEFDTLSYSGNNEKHIPYLEKMGYIKGNGRYTIKL